MRDGRRGRVPPVQRSPRAAARALDRAGPAPPRGRRCLAPRRDRPGPGRRRRGRVVVGRLCERRRRPISEKKASPGQRKVVSAGAVSGTFVVDALVRVLELVVIRGGRGAEAPAVARPASFTRSAAAVAGPATRPPPRGRRAGRGRAARGPRRRRTWPRHFEAAWRALSRSAAAKAASPRRRSRNSRGPSPRPPRGPPRRPRAAPSRGCSVPALADERVGGGGQASPRAVATAGGPRPAPQRVPRPRVDPRRGPPETRRVRERPGRALEARRRVLGGPRGAPPPARAPPRASARRGARTRRASGAGPRRRRTWASCFEWPLSLSRRQGRATTTS